jgi:hypothetical protein
MLIERMRKRLAADRASFIEPCLPSPADQPPSAFEASWRHWLAWAKLSEMEQSDEAVK